MLKIQLNTCSAQFFMHNLNLKSILKYAETKTLILWTIV
jgi:hypothetical protein